MIPLVLLLAAGAAPARQDVRYVGASVARVRASAAENSEVRATLPIGVEVRVIRASGEALEIEALDGARGFVTAALLDREPPALDALLERYRATGQLTYLERAAALAPSDLEVIERFAAAQRTPELVYLARKGWVAARRRSLMWDGPLYPIDQGRARFPARCEDHAKHPGGPDGMESDSLDGETKDERRRAFRWVSSGKVVSLSERGYTTEHLKAPSCDGDRLAYPVRGVRGALAPSWTVAGFTVTPVRDRVARSARVRVELSVEGKRLRVRALTFATSREGALELSRAAEPIAVFSEAPGAFTLLLQASECAPRESTVFLVRARAELEALRLEEGRPWGCGQSRFEQLEGEPRDVSHEALLGEGWKH